MAPLRILQIVTKMDEGGAMVLPLHLAAAFRARGHVVETWYLYRERPMFENEPGVRVIWPGKGSSIVFYCRVFWTVLMEMRRFRPDVVHGVLPLGNIIGLTAAWLCGCRRRIASQHTPVSTIHPARRALDMLAGTVGIYTGIVAVSRSVLDDLSDRPAAYRSKAQVILNAVQDLASDRSQVEARARFGLPAGRALIGTVGRLSPEKNHTFAIRLLVQAPDLHLAIAGDGVQRAACERLAAELAVADRLHMVGSIRKEEIPDFLRALDIFVLPSAYEGLPIALIEAMKMGLPVVASDIAPAREVLAPAGGGEFGLLRSTDDPDAWVATIAALIRDGDMHRRYADAALARAADFSFDTMIDHYERLFAAGTSPRGAAAVRSVLSYWMLSVW